MSDVNVNYSGILMTVPYQTFQTMKKRIDELVAENLALKKCPPEIQDDEADLRAALYAALPVIQFAVSNLNPESVRGWPHAQLDALGRHLKEVTDDPRILEMAGAFCSQARHAADIDAFRQERVADAKELFTVAPKDS
ncbi:hypothetical protein LCGC14_0522700 [marine sediment metagenome]|uniref:Uncharacterized protein n=1 Tax=marine sediment metagenome TaxID=412755 RepID=A0A0F9V664_9ZZZZ